MTELGWEHHWPMFYSMEALRVMLWPELDMSEHDQRRLFIGLGYLADERRDWFREHEEELRIEGRRAFAAMMKKLIDRAGTR